MSSIDKSRQTNSTLSYLALAVLQCTCTQTVSAEMVSDLPTYSYDIEHTSDNITVTGHVDPSQNIGERVSIAFPPLEFLSLEISEDISAIEQAPEDDFYCSSLEDDIPTDLTLTHSNDNLVTYRFKPIAGADPEEQLVYKYLQGTVVKNSSTGEILHMVLEAPHSFKLSWLVKINDLKIEVQCQPTLDGRTYAARTEVTINGSAAMQIFEEMEITTISNVTRVGEKDT